MNADIPVMIRRVQALQLGCALMLGMCALIAPLPLAAQAPAEGSVMGSVSNSQTKAFLEGVVVSLEGSAFTTTSQRGGSFNFSRVPAGRYTLKAFYTGLDSKDTPVIVTAGQTIEVSIGLTSDVYKL